MFYGVMAIGLTSVIRYGYRALYHHPWFAVKYLDIQGGQEKTHRELRKSLAWVNGLNIVSLNLHEVHSVVAANPFVSKATVTSELPDGLRIRVVEYRPAALVRNETGIFAINNLGQVIGPYEAFPGGLDLPVIEDAFNQPDREFRLGKGLAALNAIRETSLLFWDNLETLSLADPQNMVAHLRNTPAPVYLGSEIVTANIRNYLSIADRIRIEYPEVAYIELGFPGQIAVLPKSIQQE